MPKFFTSFINKFRPAIAPTNIGDDTRESEQSQYDALLSLGYFEDNHLPAEWREELARALNMRFVELGALTDNLHRPDSEVWKQAAESMREEIGTQLINTRAPARTGSITRDNTHNRELSVEKQELERHRTRSR